MTIPTIFDFQELRKRIDQAEAKLRADREDLERAERSCQHEWGEVTYDPIRHPGSPGSMPTDGSHVPYDDFPFRQPSPPRTEDRWSRTCARCGKVQKTTRTRANIKTEPAF